MNSPSYLAEIKARGPVLKYPLEFPIPGPTGDPVDVIEFREPTAGDILLHGNPVLRAEPSEGMWKVERDQQKYFDMMQALCGISVAMLVRMSPNDLIACQMQLDRFFIPGFKTRITSGTKENSWPPVEQPAN